MTAMEWYDVTESVSIGKHSVVEGEIVVCRATMSARFEVINLAFPNTNRVKASVYNWLPGSTFATRDEAKRAVDEIVHPQEAGFLQLG